MAFRAASETSLRACLMAASISASARASPSAAWRRSPARWKLGPNLVAKRLQVLEALVQIRLQIVRRRHDGPPPRRAGPVAIRNDATGAYLQFAKSNPASLARALCRKSTGHHDVQARLFLLALVSPRLRLREENARGRRSRRTVEDDGDGRAFARSKARQPRSSATRSARRDAAASARRSAATSAPAQRRRGRRRSSGTSSTRNPDRECESPAP